MRKTFGRILLVVCGNMGAGKDTLADAVHALVPGSERDAFANPLKQCVHLKTGIPMWVLNGPAAVKNDPKHGAYGKTPRKLMQEEGEEARQRIGLTVWMDRLADRFLASHTKLMIVSDGRHPGEEIVALKERIGSQALVLFVRVRRPGDETWKENNHVSESRIAAMSDDQFDYVVVNDETLDDLKEKKARQLAVSAILRAMTGATFLQQGYQIKSPEGIVDPWPYDLIEDAEQVAKHRGPGNEVITTRFDSIIVN